MKIPAWCPKITPRASNEDAKPPPAYALGLRARVIVGFGLGALLLSTFLSFVTYLNVRHTLVSQRERLSERQAFLNAQSVRNSLRTSRTEVPRLLGSLEIPSGSEAVLQYQDNWFGSSVRFNKSSLPLAFRDKVTAGSPAKMRFSINGQTYLAVGTPISAVNAHYFEITALSELDRTLTTLAATLITVSTATTLGGIALGRWASGYVLRPVVEAATVAKTIAEGNMTNRLMPDGDADLDRLVLSFNAMVDALANRIQRDARFASNVSHELRSPLMTLASAMSVLQSRSVDLPERSRTALDILASEIERFQRMVQDLLEISRSDAGQVDLVMEEVRLGELVARATEASHHSIPLNVNQEDTDTVLTVDKRRIERALANLISNAESYANGVVCINAHKEGNVARIYVDDAGPGIPEDERERIFDRFARGSTAKARASGEGTGLGLSLVQEHVRLHEGRVWVEDSPQGGARFVIELPVN